MDSIVIALPKIEDARKLRTSLERHGLSVAAVSSSASGVLSHLSELGSGILICGFRLPDMNYMELIDCMPSDFDMLFSLDHRQGFSVKPRNQLWDWQCRQRLRILSIRFICFLFSGNAAEKRTKENRQRGPGRSRTIFQTQK